MITETFKAHLVKLGYTSIRFAGCDIYAIGPETSRYGTLLTTVVPGCTSHQHRVGPYGPEGISIELDNVTVVKLTYRNTVESLI